MGRIVPTGIKDSSDLDGGNYLGNVENFEEKFTQDKQKLMYSAQIRILAPESRKNRIHFQNFVIGTDEDPNAEQQITWQQRGDQLKRFCKAIGVPLEGEDMDIITRQVIRKNVCFRLEHRPGKGEFAGRTFVNVVKWAPEGMMEPMLDAIEAPVGAINPAPAPTPPAQPVEPVIPPGNTQPPAEIPAPLTQPKPQGDNQYPFVPPVPPAA